MPSPFLKILIQSSSFDSACIRNERRNSHSSIYDRSMSTEMLSQSLATRHRFSRIRIGRIISKFRENRETLSPISFKRSHWQKPNYRFKARLQFYETKIFHFLRPSMDANWHWKPIRNKQWAAQFSSGQWQVFHWRFLHAPMNKGDHYDYALSALPIHWVLPSTT